MGIGTGLAVGLANIGEREHEEKRQDELSLRNIQAQNIENEIVAIESQPLDRNDPNAAQTRAGIVDSLQKKLMGLYQPHEAPSLFQRLGNLTKRRTSGLPTGPGGTPLPGMPEYPTGSALPTS